MYPQHGFPQEDIQSLEDGLAKLDLKPDDFEIVILTHLHWDHISLARKFINAEFIVQKDELDFARNPHPASAMTGDYSNKVFNDLKLRVIEGDKEIIDGVRVFLTPGHSPGAQSVAVNTPDGVAVITGFCCSLANFDPPRHIKEKGYPVVTTGLHLDIRQAYDSGLKVKQTADIVLPLHECSFIGKDRIP
jgi:glyoxylase-like metal-dependent hydrolase (beta-lactamase superfamily II)